MGAKSFLWAATLMATLLCVVPQSPYAAEAKSPAEQSATDPVGGKILEQMAALTAALQSLPPGQFDRMDGGSAQAKALATEMSRVSLTFAGVTSESSAAALDKAVGQLKTALSSASPATKTFLQKQSAYAENLNGLKMAIQDLKLTDAGLVVQVTEAKFGDTPASPVIKRRWCDATAYMRARCNRQLNCSLDANYQDQVCGFNPAPSAEPRNRGLYVRYACVPNIESNFITTNGNAAASTSSETLSEKDLSKYVVLRGSGSIVCGAAPK